MRKLILALLLALLLPVQSWAAMAHVQSNCVSGNLFAGTNSYVYTYPAGITAGNLTIAVTGIEDNRTVSTTAGTGTTYTINGANQNNASAGYNLSQWKGIATGSDTTVTVTLSGTSAQPAYFCFAEFSGASSDQSGSTANGASFDAVTAHDSGTVTPPTADNVVVATAQSTPGTWTDDGAFTQVTTGTTAFHFGYLIQAAATTQENNMTAVDNEYSAMRIGAFAGTSSSTPNFFNRRLQVNP